MTEQCPLCFRYFESDLSLIRHKTSECIHRFDKPAREPREVRVRLQSVERPKLGHGGLSPITCYGRGCREPECVEAYNAHMREWKASRKGPDKRKIKLDEEKVRWIRENATGRNAASMARELGVSSVLVSQVIRGKAWAHVS